VPIDPTQAAAPAPPPSQPATNAAPPSVPVAAPAPVAAAVVVPVAPPAHHAVVSHPHVAAAHHAAAALKLTTAPLKPILTRLKIASVLQIASVLPRASSAFVPPAGVTPVPPSEVQVAGATMAPPRTATPPKTPSLPPTPNGPTNDSPISFGGALSGPVGGAVLLFAALAAAFAIIMPWLTSRVAMAVAPPVEWRRRLSLERPG
jgi:hypothetical protein